MQSRMNFAMDAYGKPKQFEQPLFNERPKQLVQQWRKSNLKSKKRRERTQDKNVWLVPVSFGRIVHCTMCRERCSLGKRTKKFWTKKSEHVRWVMPKKVAISVCAASYIYSLIAYIARDRMHPWNVRLSVRSEALCSHKEPFANWCRRVPV